MRFFLPTIDRDLASSMEGVDFVMAYIEEAHAEDEWPISSGRFHDGVPVRVTQPRTLKERIAVANSFREKYSVTHCMTLVDNPETGNPFERTFAPWPIRFYVVLNGRIKYIADPTDCEYSLAELQKRIF